LDKTRVLTAAHCELTTKHTVWVGGIKADGSDKKQEARIKYVRNHPDYNKKTSDDDITLLHLSDELQFNPTVQPVNLGTETEFKEVEHGSNCRIVGHGRITDDGDFETELQVGAQVHIGSTNDDVTCKKFIKKAKNCFLTKGTGGIQGCRGDSGGPLYCSVGSPPTFKQFGVASFVGGKTCTDGRTGWFLPIRYKSFLDSDPSLWELFWMMKYSRIIFELLIIALLVGCYKKWKSKKKNQIQKNSLPKKSDNGRQAISPTVMAPAPGLPDRNKV